MAAQEMTGERYNKLRFITICLTTLQLPFGTFVGFELGSGHLQMGLVALIAQTLITFTQAHLFWRTLENAR